jgi:hypothetical protein
MLALLLMLAVVPGCGGGDDDEFDSDDPRRTVALYLEAHVDEDAAAVCDLIAREESGIKGPSGRCEAGVEKQFARFDTPDADADEVIGDVSIDGDTARIENPATGGYTDLIKVEGEWKILIPNQER